MSEKGRRQLDRIQNAVDSLEKEAGENGDDAGGGAVVAVQQFLDSLHLHPDLRRLLRTKPRVS